MSPKPTVTKLKGDEISVAEDMRVKALWLVQRYSSVAVIARTVDLLAQFLAGWEDYARRNQGGDAAWYRETFRVLFTHQAELEKGLELLRQGYSSGYGYVVAGLQTVDYLSSRRFMDPPIEFSALGYVDFPGRPASLFSWADRAITLGALIAITLEAKWAFPRIMDPFSGNCYFGPVRFPSRLEPLPKRLEARIFSSEEVPVTGVWLPLDIPNACPNFLWAGRIAPQGMRLAERIVFAPLPAGPWTPARPERIRYLYTPKQTAWQLLWEDRRYQGGQVPDESEYLDESTDYPPYPPKVLTVIEPSV